MGLVPGSHTGIPAPGTSRHWDLGHSPTRKFHLQLVYRNNLGNCAISIKNEEGQPRQQLGLQRPLAAVTAVAGRVSAGRDRSAVLLFHFPQRTCGSFSVRAQDKHRRSTEPQRCRPDRRRPSLTRNLRSPRCPPRSAVSAFINPANASGDALDSRSAVLSCPGGHSAGLPATLWAARTLLSRLSWRS